jgi:hypothetical protein
MNNKRVHNFIKGFLMGIVIGIFFSLIILLTGAGGRAPAPGIFTAESAEIAVLGTPCGENTRRVNDIHNLSSNAGRVCLPAPSYLAAGINDTIFSQPIASPPPGRSAGLCLVAAGRPAENDSALLATENTEFTEDIKIGRINDTQQIAGPDGLPPAVGPNYFISINHGFTRINTDFLNDLIDKIWQQESSGRLNPPDGDGGKAIGPLQIHQEALTDVNQRFGLNYVLEDMRDIAKAKVVAKLYITMHLDNNLEEIAARIFNGGPRGWEKPQTREYYKK